MKVLTGIVFDGDDRVPVAHIEDVASVLRSVGIDMMREHFLVLSLDARGRLIACDIAAIGTLTACLVHPREIFRLALSRCAAQIVCAHNHPSGSVSPSEEDLVLSQRLKEAGQVLGIPVVDCVVFTAQDVVSCG